MKFLCVRCGKEKDISEAAFTERNGQVCLQCAGFKGGIMKYLSLISMFFVGCVSIPIEKSFKDELKWNYYENNYSYSEPQSVMKYNYMEKVHTYEHPDSKLRFNYLSKKYEFSK